MVAGIALGLSTSTISPSIVWTRYSTEGAVAMRLRSNSRSSRSRTISMWRRPRKPHRKPKPERAGRLGLVGDARIVQSQLLERLSEVRVVVAVDRVQPAEHHRLRVLIALERLAGPRRLGDRLAAAGLAHVLDAGDEVADLAGLEHRDRCRRRSAEADLVGVVHRVRLQEPQPCAGRQTAVHHPHRADHAAVLVEVRIEDEGLQRRVAVTRRRAGCGRPRRRAARGRPPPSWH